jgi:hypothetical protein
MHPINRSDVPSMVHDSCPWFAMPTVCDAVTPYFDYDIGYRLQHHYIQMTLKLSRRQHIHRRYLQLLPRGHRRSITMGLMELTVCRHLRLLPLRTPMATTLHTPKPRYSTKWMTCCTAGEAERDHARRAGPSTKSRLLEPRRE